MDGNQAGSRAFALSGLLKVSRAMGPVVSKMMSATVFPLRGGAYPNVYTYMMCLHACCLQ